MRKTSIILLNIAIAFGFTYQTQAKNKYPAVTKNLYFIENKGQVKDQSSNQRNDIQYVLQSPGLTVFIGNNQLHYQFSKRVARNSQPDAFLPVTSARQSNTLSEKGNQHKDIAEIANELSSDIATYRMDVELVGANKLPELITEQPLSYYENYFIPGCPANGVRAYTYSKIIYKNVYPGIDWVLKIKDNKLEHEFVLGPGADASEIRLKYNGQSSLKINEDGSVTATTPMGTIKEHAPVCYRGDGSLTPSSFSLHKNILSYNGALTGALVIDPILEWGTYYGPDSSTSYLQDAACDDSANVYATGLTYGGAAGTIATTGTYSYTLTDVGTTDAFLVKFDSSGHRIWGTYFGGNSNEWGTAVGCDHSGHVYIGGSTSSDSGIATPGAHIPRYVHDEHWVGFIAKFTAAGMRQWATYIGGDSSSTGVIGATTYDLEVASIACDTLGHVFLSGSCDDTSNVTTCCSFLPRKYYGADTIQDFLIQYDTTGAEIWGTYYGDWWHNYVGGMCTDGNNVYLCGSTSGGGIGRDPVGTDIPSPGCWQPVFSGGGSDDFLVKFDNAGNRLWGTYYGGPSSEQTGAIGCDKFGNVYLLGATASDSGIATPGAYQPARAGGADVFVAKFNGSTGMRIWGTYYGGPDDESLDLSDNMAVDNAGNPYICGYTVSLTGIATACAQQPVYGGGLYDAFFAKFDTGGVHCWGTYYGGNGQDNAMNCATDGRNVYICGWTNSSDNIATPGSFLDAGYGLSSYQQGFLAKFSTCNCPDTLVADIGAICVDSVINLSYPTTGGAWTSSDTAIASVTAGLVKGREVGMDTVRYSVSNTCTLYENPIQVTDDCREGVKSFSAATPVIAVFPNPAGDNITITATLTVNKVEISNLAGQAVFSGIYNNNKVTISLAQLPAGVYFVKVNDVNIYKITKE